MIVDTTPVINSNSKFRELGEMWANHEAIKVGGIYLNITGVNPAIELGYGTWVIATNIKQYLPPVLRLLFTLVKEKKEGYRITLQQVICG